MVSPKAKKQPPKQDVLEAYPLRLHVNALPDRRFFKMTRTLTIVNCLLVCFLIAVACFFYYAMDNQDISISYGNGANALFRIDPESKTLRQIELNRLTVSPIQLLTEEKLMNYIEKAHKIVWDTEEMAIVLNSDKSILRQLTNQRLLQNMLTMQKNAMQSLRAKGLIRDVHIYQLKLIYQNLWVAILDTFDIPLNNNLESFCPCQNNSQECLWCKTDEAKAHVRYKIWIRTSLNKANETAENPLGISVDSYSIQWIPIHPQATYWDLPPMLRPDI